MNMFLRRSDWSKVEVELAHGLIIHDETLQSEREFRDFCNEYGYKLLKFELGTNPCCKK